MNSIKRHIFKNILFIFISYIIAIDSPNLFAMEEEKSQEAEKKHRKTRLSRRASLRKLITPLTHSDKRNSKSDGTPSLNSQEENGNGISSLGLEKSQRSSSTSLSPKDSNSSPHSHKETKLQDEYMDFVNYFFDLDFQKNLNKNTDEEDNSSYIECKPFEIENNTADIKSKSSKIKNKFSDLEIKTSKIDNNPFDPAKLIVLTYPFFFPNEKDFFSRLIPLKEQYPEQITAFLNQLVRTGFPNGLINLQSAKHEFNDLKRGLVDDPIFDIVLLNVLIPNQPEIKIISEIIEEKREEGSCDIDLNKWDMSLFTNALTARDIFLAQAISLEDLGKYLKSQNNPPKSIQSFIEHADRTSRNIVFRLLCDPSQEERENQIKQLCCMTKLLIHHKNGHGAMQLGTAMTMNAVNRLRSKELEEVKIVKEVEGATSPLKNYSKYRKNKYSFSAFSVLTADFLHIFDTYESSYDFELKLNILKSLGNTVEVFLEYRKISYPEIDPTYLRLVCGFKTIDEKTLEILSDYHKPWPIVRSNPSSPLEMREGSPWHFASLLKENRNEYLIPSFFKKGLLNVQDMIDYIGKGTLEERKEKLYILGMDGHILQLMSPNPSLNDLNHIKPGAIRLFCIEGELCFKTHITNIIKILKSDLSENGLDPEIVDRVLGTLQDFITPISDKAGSRKKKEKAKEQSESNNLYNGAFKKISQQDEKALLQYFLLKGYTPMDEKLVNILLSEVSP